MTAVDTPQSTTTPLKGIRKVAARRMVQAWAVPVFHLTVEVDMTAARRDVVGRARAGKLRSADVAGGTFTVSNLGMLGIDYFDAILNIPQVAILAVGATTHRQVWNGGNPAWRPVAELTLTCDHRAVDGATGAGFLSTLRDLLQA